MDRQTGSRDGKTLTGRWENRHNDSQTARRGVGRRDCLTDSRRRTGGQADRQLRRSTGSHTVRLRYPGNEQLISHSQITEFSSIFIVPGGQLGRANGQTLGQGDRRGRQDGRGRQTSRDGGSTHCWTFNTHSCCSHATRHSGVVITTKIPHQHHY